MYGKIFASMYEGTLYGKWEALVTFQQLIVLADQDGIVDMTPEVISARTSIPIDIIKKGIKTLEESDPDSRTEGEDGKRIIRLNPNRIWGWKIVNHAHYRNLASSADRREYMKGYMREHRKETTNEDVNKRKQSVNKRKSQLAQLTHTDTDTDTDTDKKEDIQLLVVLRDKSYFKITEEKISQYQEVYPNINVRQEILKIIQWNEDNPDKRKTRRGILRHINTWLSGAQGETKNIEAAPKQKTLKEVKREAGLDDFTPEQLKAGKERLSKVAMDVMKKKDINRIIGDKK